MAEGWEAVRAARLREARARASSVSSTQDGDVSYDEIALLWAILLLAHLPHQKPPNPLPLMTTNKKGIETTKLPQTAAPTSTFDVKTLDCHARRPSLLIIWSHPSARAALHAVGNQPLSKTTGRMADQPAAADRRGEPPR